MGSRSSRRILREQMRRGIRENPPRSLVEQKLGPSPLRDAYRAGSRYWQMIEDPAIRLGRLAAERLASAAAAQLPEPAAAPEAIGVFHGTLDQARELAIRAAYVERFA